MSRNAHTVFLALCMYPSRLLLLGVALGSIFGCDEHRTSSRPPTPQSTAASEPSPHESVPVRTKLSSPAPPLAGLRDRLPCHHYRHPLPLGPGA